MLPFSGMVLSVSNRTSNKDSHWGLFAVRWVYPASLLAFVMLGPGTGDNASLASAVVLAVIFALSNLLLALLLVLNLWTPALPALVVALDFLLALAGIALTDVRLGWLALIPIGTLGVFLSNWLVSLGIGLMAAMIMLGFQIVLNGGTLSLPPGMFIALLAAFPVAGPILTLLTREGSTSASLEMPRRPARNTSATQEVSNYIQIIYDMAEVLSLSRLDPIRVMDAAISVGLDGLTRVGIRPPLFGAILLFAEQTTDTEIQTVLRVIRTSETVALADHNLELPGNSGVIARALNQAETVLETAPMEDPELSHFESFGSCGTVMCLPLRTGNEAYGVMLVGTQEKNVFRSVHVDLMNALANQAAASINNARLYVSLREQRDRILEVEKSTRAQLAAELHDGPTQGMSAITMRLNYARRLLEKDPQNAFDELYQIEELARSTTKEIRAMLFTLRPKALEQGLSAGLEQLARQMQETYGQEVRVEGEPGIDTLLDSQTEQTLFSIATEATTNARKHAGAEVILLRTYRQSGAFVLEIRDNGVGFDVNEAIAEARQREGHLGLINLFDRTALIDGTLHIESVPNRGTRLLIAVPLDVLEQRKTEELAEAARKH